MEIESRVRLLKTAAAITMGFGVVIAAAAIPALNLPTALMMDMIVPPVDGGQAIESTATRLLSAICGGVLIGWGLMAWILAVEILPGNPTLARRLIIPSIGAWFLVDSSMSIAAGAPLNAVLNIAFLVLFTLPVLGLDTSRAKAAS